MESERPSLFRRAIAIAVLLVVAVIALLVAWRATRKGAGSA